jgi:hypothetical protein
MLISVAEPEPQGGAPFLLLGPEFFLPYIRQGNEVEAEPRPGAALKWCGSALKGHSLRAGFQLFNGLTSSLQYIKVIC